MCPLRSQPYNGKVFTLLNSEEDDFTRITPKMSSIHWWSPPNQLSRIVKAKNNFVPKYQSIPAKTSDLLWKHSKVNTKKAQFLMRSTSQSKQNFIFRLIKVPFIDESSSTVKKEVKAEFNGKYNFSSIGKSKIKALQNGMKQTGIYRQFYNSQAKSSSVIHSYKWYFFHFELWSSWIKHL